MKLSASLAGQIADLLVKETSSIIESHNKKITSAMKDLSSATLSKADELASARLHSTRQQYVDALKLEKIGPNIYSVSLDDSAAHLETGYESYNMIQAGLARGAKSKVSKEGYRYVSIPFGQNANAKAGTPSGDKQVQHTQTVEQRGWNPNLQSSAGVKPAVGLHSGTSLASGIQDLNKAAGIKGSKGESEGASHSYHSFPMNSKKFIVKDKAGNESIHDVPNDKEFNSLYDGMRRNINKVGKSNKASYMTFRTASENPNAKGKWQHPGFAGIFAFKELEAWAHQQLEKILSDL